MPRGEALTLGKGGAQRGQIVVVFPLCYDGADESTLLTDGSEQVGVGVEPVERFALNVFILHLIVNLAIIRRVEVDVH